MKTFAAIGPALAISVGVGTAFSFSALADEGMWTFNAFPKDELARKHKVKVDDAWLEHVRLSSARLAQGCSASFVSPEGLVMTNHHCAHSCIAQLSTAEKDLVKTGFTARSRTDELRCPELEVNQLVAIEDVTQRMRQATKGLRGTAYNDAEKAERSKIEQACAKGDEVRCDVVSLYRGGIYNLYQYRRHQDVRLVFAPELDIAFFGGDPDNFNFPRYVLDVAFLRVWNGEQPVKLEHHFAFSPKGPKEGEVVFVSGNPGGTSRLLTVAQFEYLRDVALPDRLLKLAELRGFVTEYQNRGVEQKRTSQRLLFGIENGFKALRGRHAALLDKAFFATLVENERALREKVAANPEWRKAYGGAWDAIARTQQRRRALATRHSFIEGGQSFSGSLFGRAKTLVRAADERPKPLAKRFREFRDSALPGITQSLFSAAPIYDELEIARLTFSLTKMREELGADDPFVRKVLEARSPEELAQHLVKGTSLKSVDARRALWSGGRQAIRASKDPFILLARLIDRDARAIRKIYEDEVEAPTKENEELIAKARFAILGTSTYPDATFSSRLSFGTVKGWVENGKAVRPFTNIGGAFARATGRQPFALPPSWLGARNRLVEKTPLNFVSTNDIIGGNSGSPVINAAGQVVGLIFDGNIHSLGGDYGFDETKNRAISVHSEAIMHTLAKVYGAQSLVEELRPTAGRSARDPKTRRPRAATDGPAGAQTAGAPAGAAGPASASAGSANP